MGPVMRLNFLTSLNEIRPRHHTSKIPPLCCPQRYPCQQNRPHRFDRTRSHFMKQQKVCDTQRGSKTMRGMKSVMLLCAAGMLLVSGCMSPLYNAAKRGDINTVKELLDKG